MKTTRFTELVKKAGAPNSYLLWVSPKRDRVFQRAIKEQRVLTIHQENVGTKKDYGMVGFHEQPNAQYLVFPKSLKAFVDRRIVGINYDLLAKESRAGKTPEIERRSLAAKSPKQKASKPPSTKSENIVAFEAVVKESAAEQELSPRSTSASKSSKSVKRPQQPKPSKPPRQEEPTEPAKPMRSGKPARHDPAVGSRVLSVVRRAMKDLDAGKTVAAYKKLEALLAETENEDG